MAILGSVCSESRRGCASELVGVLHVDEDELAVAGDEAVVGEEPARAARCEADKQCKAVWVARSGDAPDDRQAAADGFVSGPGADGGLAGEPAADVDDEEPTRLGKTS
jgi:hypothetical protein